MYLGYRFIFPTYFISDRRVLCGAAFFCPHCSGYIFLRARFARGAAIFFFTNREQNLTRRSRFLFPSSLVFGTVSFCTHDLVQLGPSINYIISYTTLHQTKFTKDRFPFLLCRVVCVPYCCGIVCVSFHKCWPPFMVVASRALSVWIRRAANISHVFLLFSCHAVAIASWVESSNVRQSKRDTWLELFNRNWRDNSDKSWSKNHVGGW